MSDLPTRLVAALVDRYRIERELGAGGMATVYLAEDLKHDRKVALKVLKPELAALVGAERFLAEIRTTANLQHPHILPLFDSGQDDGLVWYTMPHVEGDSLRDRLDREKQLPVEEAVAIAEKVAGALQAAHDRGVVHRDIKPANVLLDARGQPLVSDFGIALAVQEAGGGRLTETGLSLGTPHYMSPEQATADRDVDPRSDVYSLACVLYEMLAGEPPFSGSTAQAVLARILTEEPRPLTASRKSVPANVVAAVRKGLEKLPADRFPDAESFARALADPAFVHRIGGGQGSREGARALAGARGTALRRRLHAAVTLVLGLAALALWLTRPSTRRAADSAPSLSFVVAESPQGGLGRVDMASDGTVAWIENGRIFVRPPGAVDGRPILDEATIVADLALSPDGAWVAWLDRDGRPWTTSLETAASTPIWEPAVEGRATDVTWTEDDVITLVASIPGGDGQRVVQVPGRGGVVAEIWRQEEPQPTISVAEVLPAGGGLLLNLLEFEPFVPRIVVLDPASGDTTLVASFAGSPAWSSSGHIVYGAADGRIWAVPWDLEERRSTGPPMVVGSNVATAPRLAVGGGGTLAYVRGRAVGVSGLVDTSAEGDLYNFNLVPPDGPPEDLPLDPSDRLDAELSPDGRLLAYGRGEELRLFDLDRGTDRVLTMGEGATWSPDSDSIAYYDPQGRITIRAADGSGTPRIVTEAPDSAYPNQWLPGGDLLVWDGNGAGEGDVWLVDPGNTAPPELILGGRWREVDARVSPDGRWLSYISSREGNPAVYLRSWPDLAGETRLSVEGEVTPAWGQPTWSPDARRIYYSVDPASGGGIRWVEVADDGSPLEGTRGSRFVGAPALRPEGMMPDGRLLLTTPQWDLSEWEGAQLERLVVVTGWTTLLREGSGGSGS